MFYFKRFDKERLNLGEVGSHLSILPFLILLTEHYIVLNFLLPGCTQDKVFLSDKPASAQLSWPVDVVLGIGLPL